MSESLGIDIIEKHDMINSELSDSLVCIDINSQTSLE